MLKKINFIIFILTLNSIIIFISSCSINLDDGAYEPNEYYEIDDNTKKFSEGESKIYDESTSKKILESEHIGKLKYNMSEKEVTDTIGECTSENQIPVYGDDNSKRYIWSYNDKGIELSIISTFDEEGIVDMITITSPCNFETAKDIKIGSTKKEVEAAYSKLGLISDSSEDYIIIGSIYSGLIFTFKNNEVIKIFLGDTV